MVKPRSSRNISLPKRRLLTAGCKCHYCTLTRLRPWDWLTPTIRTYIDLRTCPESYLAHWKLWMQTHKSKCSKALFNGDYTKLEQYTTVENELDKYIQERINNMLDRGQQLVVKGKCHANDERV